MWSTDPQPEHSIITDCSHPPPPAPPPLSTALSPGNSPPGATPTGTALHRAASCSWGWWNATPTAYWASRRGFKCTGRERTASCSCAPPTPSGPPPPPDQGDHLGKNEILLLGKSGWAICVTQTFGSQTPPSPPLLLTLPCQWRAGHTPQGTRALREKSPELQRADVQHSTIRNTMSHRQPRRVPPRLCGLVLTAREACQRWQGSGRNGDGRLQWWAVQQTLHSHPQKYPTSGLREWGGGNGRGGGMRAKNSLCTPPPFVQPPPPG